MVYQIFFKVFTLQAIKQEYASAAIANLIDGAMYKDKKWASIHEQNRYKRISFNSLYPIEKETGEYKKETVYQVIIRSLDKEFISYLAEQLPHCENKWLKGLVCEFKPMMKGHIITLYSITPLIVRGRNGGYWKEEMNLQQLGEALKINLIKKYKDATGEKMEEDFHFLTGIEILNGKPIWVPYKEVKLLADKIELQIASNESAQKLAQTALGGSLGELGSRGYGFVGARYLK